MAGPKPEAPKNSFRTKGDLAAHVDALAKQLDDLDGASLRGLLERYALKLPPPYVSKGPDDVPHLGQAPLRILPARRELASFPRRALPVGSHVPRGALPSRGMRVQRVFARAHADACGRRPALVKRTRRWASGKVEHMRYPCGWPDCGATLWTRYGFRAHMAAMHGYRSKAHRKPASP
jgi:hypothetical protein